MGLSMAQYSDIKQKIALGMSDRAIARAVGRRRSVISEIRSGKFNFSSEPEFPLWMSGLSWDEILKESKSSFCPTFQ